MIQIQNLLRFILAMVTELILTFSIGYKMFFLPSFFVLPLLCSVKKSLNRTKTTIFRFNQKSQDKFTLKF